MKLSFQAYDRAGREVVGTIDASSEAEARAKLRQQGLFVTDLGSKAIASSRAKLQLPSIKRLKGKSLVARQLSLLISTGTPLVEALGTIERQLRDDKWKATLADVRARVEDGATLADAMAANPSMFDPIACSLVRAGETGGGLEQMLERLARLTRQQEKMTSAVLGSMLYPVVLISVSIIVLVLMLTFVLPRFTTMFEALDAPLPSTTQALLVLGDALRSYWWAVPPALGLAAFGAFKLVSSDEGRARMEQLMFAAPITGRIARALIMSRLVRVLGVLLEARVPLLESLELARKSIPSQRYAALLERARESICQGEALSAILASDPSVPPAVVESVANGERSGQLGAVLCSLADFMDEDNEVLVKSLSSIIEPVILIGLGIVVGFVAISMFLPLFDLTTMTQGTPKG